MKGLEAAAREGDLRTKGAALECVGLNLWESPGYREVDWLLAKVAHRKALAIHRAAGDPDMLPTQPPN